ncbi:hypothetical protein [Kitasatospora sp. NPDC050543]|uniref:hypothetical protein n=1 Tax=Kitasatospora sp. NPDC050543 TaxID=3364054 RepID=UPI00379F6226
MRRDPSRRLCAAALLAASVLATDVRSQGQEPSTLLAQAITEIVTPDNVYDRPVPPRRRARHARGAAAMTDGVGSSGRATA